MFRTHVNSIVGVTDALGKLKNAIVKKYPNASKSRFEVGVDPFSGRYTLVVFLTDLSVAKRLPSTVDGYKVCDGFKPFDLEEGSNNA